MYNSYYLTQYRKLITGKIKVVGSLDLGSGLGNGLSGLEVGKLHLNREKQGDDVKSYKDFIKLVAGL